MEPITTRGQIFEVEESNGSGWDNATIYRIDVDGFDAPLEGRLGYEEDASFADPRDWSNVGTMAVAYRGYSLGDENAEELDFGTHCTACDGNGAIDVEGPLTETDARWGQRPVDYPCEACNGTGAVSLDPAEYFRRERGARVVIGLFVYEHSGITISAGETIAAQIAPADVRSTDRFVGDSAGWDTSFVGFIFDTPEGVAECVGEDATDEQIEAALRGEVEVYASYLEGDVTFYTVDDDETGFADGCGGYVGSRDYAESELRDALTRAIEERLDELAEYTLCA